MNNKKILVTGGAGFIGSLTVLELLINGYEVLVIDNLVNSYEESIRRVEKITSKKVSFYKEDIRNKTKLLQILNKEADIYAVIHFAGLKAVGESTQMPLKYYDNNLISSLVLLEVMQKLSINRLVFSSSATVYGEQDSPSFIESMRLNPNNPYGRTKAMIEQILMDQVNANENLDVTSLRYFNPVGAHSSGQIGEDPNGLPNNLLPFITQVAVGKRKELLIFGNDYDTKDGTGVRDYIHVADLSKGHLAALASIPKGDRYRVFNLGTGQGNSVLEVIQAFEKVSGKKIPFRIVGRRPGDIAENYANPSKANKELFWQTKLSLEDACRDAWRWQTLNPSGYQK